MKCFGPKHPSCRRYRNPWRLIPVEPPAAESWSGEVVRAAPPSLPSAPWPGLAECCGPQPLSRRRGWFLAKCFGRNTHLAAGKWIPWQSDSSGTTQLAVGAEARTWRSDAGRITPFAVGDEVDPGKSDSGRITQLTVGSAPRENQLARQ